MRDQLARSYSSMLRTPGVPISFALFVGERRLTARSHCVWGENRSAHLADLGEVSAFQPIDRTLPERRYCTYCMRWLAADETACTTPNCNVITRARAVRGWIGLQRYLHEGDFGIDFIRNGRKIEFGNKDLFNWTVDGIAEREYPIDDPRAGGRIVGEIHLDHCRVHYTKTHFEQTDPAWGEMISIVRGTGPLRPEKARAEGFGANHSPLYRLFQAYRRSQPRQRQSVGWSRLLRVKDNARAIEMAKLYDEGMPEYQSDEKWWELCQAEDARHLREDEPGPTPGEVPTGFIDEGEDEAPDQPGAPVEPAPPPPAAPVRERDAELSREYDAFWRNGPHFRCLAARSSVSAVENRRLSDPKQPI